MLDEIAKENGYVNKTELLYAYNIIPSVRTSKRRRWKFVLLLWKHIKQKH